MAKILVIESFLSKDYSLAHYATKKFIEEYQKKHPNDEVITLDLNQEQKLQTVLSANNFDTFWNEDSQRYIDLLFSVDKIIVGTGMVNFFISPVLKNFLDNVLVANKTFKYKYDGKGESEGLLNPNTKVQLIMSQGADKGWYPFAGFDNYLEHVFEFAGIKNIQSLVFYGTKTHEQRDLNIEQKFKLKEKEFNNCLENF